MRHPCFVYGTIPLSHRKGELRRSRWSSSQAAPVSTRFWRPGATAAAGRFQCRGATFMPLPAAQPDMCFSASASFAAGAFLLGIGTLTRKAARTPNERPFAAIPLLFALQQFIEGAVWLTFSHDAPLTNEVMTYAFSFFSLLLWPVFVPAAVLLIEPPGWRRQGLRVFVAACAIASGSLLYTMTGYGIVSRVTGQPIDYVIPHFFPVATMLLYLLSTSASELLSTYGEVKIFRLLVMFSFGAAYVVYTHWFISVWCCFAAALSAVVLPHFSAVPMLAKQVRA